MGGGAVISEAYREVREFANLLDAPVCDTLMGKGVIDGNDERYTGMIGMHGTKTSNFGVSGCDLLIALGARFSDRVVGNPKRFAEHAKVPHIDVDAAEINKNIKTDVSLVGDLKEVLSQLNGRLSAQKHEAWMAHIAELKSKYPLNYDESVLSCPYIMEEIDRVTKGKPSLPRTWDSTRCGRHSIIGTAPRAPCLPQADSAPWAMVLAHASARRWGGLTKSASILRATGVFA